MQLFLLPHLSGLVDELRAKYNINASGAFLNRRNRCVRKGAKSVHVFGGESWPWTPFTQQISLFQFRPVTRTGNTW